MRTQWCVIAISGNGTTLQIVPIAAEHVKGLSKSRLEAPAGSPACYQRIDNVPEEESGEAVAKLLLETCDNRRYEGAAPPLRYEQLGLGKIIFAPKP